MFRDNNNENNDSPWDNRDYHTNYRIENLPSPTIPSTPKRKKTGIKAIALVLCCALAGGGAGIAGAALYTSMHNRANNNTAIYQNSTVPSTQVNIKQSNGLTEMTLSEIYSAYANSSVVVTCEINYTTNTWFGPSSQSATSAGSGFVISENGYIVTNYHVIDGSSSIKVTLFDGTELDAVFVGGEEVNDVAVLKVDAAGLTPVVLGDSDTLVVGETVCTIGNALGTLSFSQTAGVVSGLNRAVTYSDDTVVNMVQTDCTINSGNSGGPLFDQYGRVVGIASAKYSGSTTSSGASIENIGFAIPINDVKDMITDIMQYGHVKNKPSMGITVATITEELSQQLNLPKGAYVNSVEPGSCAEAAGLMQGDVITALGDTQVASSNELIAAKNKFKAGQEAQLTVYRSGQTLSITIVFDEEQNTPVPPNNTPQSEQQQPSEEQNDDYRDFFHNFGF